MRLARVGIGPDVNVQVASVVEDDGLALVLGAQLQARHHGFGLGGVHDFILFVQLVAVHRFVGRSVEVAVLQAYARAAVIPEAARLRGLAAGRRLQHQHAFALGRGPVQLYVDHAFGRDCEVPGMGPGFGHYEGPEAGRQLQAGVPRVRSYPARGGREGVERKAAGQGGG